MKKTLLLSALLAFVVKMNAAVDPNFYVYLCFGQSNMEGQAQPEAVDNVVDERFQMLACVDFNSTTPKRTKGQWYTANCPIVRDWTKIGMADYFGRTMVAALPAGVKVGVVDVAIGGVAIEGFMQEEVAGYLKNQESWMKNSFAAYDNDPYQRLVDMAKIAQQKGVIKGILLHQGESNNGQTAWLQKVKTIYGRLLSDLGLQAADVPLFAGETVGAEVGGTCSAHNAIIAQLPTVIPTAHVVHSDWCPCASDNIHFTVAGYRTMGKRYAYEALRTMGLDTRAQDGYAWNSELKKVYQLTRLNAVDAIKLRKGGSRMLALKGTFADGHVEDLTLEATFTSSDFTIRDGAVVGTEEKKGTVRATYTDFLGATHTLDISVEVSDQSPNHVLVVNNGSSAGSNQWDKEAICSLAIPMQKGKTYVIRATMWGDHSGDCAVWPRWDASTNRDQWGNSADIQYLATNAVGTTPQELTWRCSPANYTHDVLIFAIGKMGAGNVYFDDVSCMEEGGSTEMIANGNFESDDISNWSYLTWAGMSVSVKDDPTSSSIQPQRLSPSADGAVYTPQGIKVGAASEWARMPRGLYITGGKAVLKR